MEQVLEPLEMVNIGDLKGVTPSICELKIEVA